MGVGDWMKKLLCAPDPPALVLLKSTSWTCANCDAAHQGMFDLGSNSPDFWITVGTDEQCEPNSAIRLDGNFLSSDFCVIEGQYFFIRAVLPIPVIGMTEHFGFGAWSTLSRDNFENYLTGFDDGHYSDPGPWFGWLANRLADYVDDDPVPLSVELQPDTQRPKLYVDDPDHPLAIAQQEGITAERLLEIYRFHGHGPMAG